MQTSVVEALKAAGLYKETGRIMEQMLKTVLPNGEVREHKMAEIDYLDVKIFVDELDIALKLQNPLVQSLFAKNTVGLVNLIRVINCDSASGFKGSVGSGRQLDAILIRAEQLQDPDTAIVAGGIANRRNSWIRTIGAGDIGVVSNFIEGDYAIAPADCPYPSTPPTLPKPSPPMSRGTWMTSRPVCPRICLPYLIAR